MNVDPVKFLLVDDVEDNLVALEALLRREGLQILTARSGPEALELLLVHEVALALLDVQMPDMNGFELAVLMRGAARTKHVPIIFVTASGPDRQRLFKGYETGAVDFLYKPIEPNVLLGKADVFFELHRQRKELSEALRLNEMFVGILGHDLRNPLGAMLTGAQLLERQPCDERQLRTLRRMVSAGNRMTEMVEQLLDLTRARLAGGLGFLCARERLDVGDLVRRTVEELRGAHPEREVIVDTAGDCSSSGDPDRLLQLFSNLVANALHHGAPDAAVSVSVHCAEHDIVLRVQNGGAIRPDMLPTLFDPFREKPGTPSKSRGLGLGLFISQQIAIAHGGAVSVDSSEEEGTSFFVRLPRRALASEVSAAKSTRTVLIVENDEHVRDSLCEVFEAEGYAVAARSSGRDALDLLTQGELRPDVVILDLVLPVMNGGQVYAAMQADEALAKIPVIVSTSTLTCAPPGVIVLPKPLRLERLLDAVANVWREDA
jgi:two-component system, sensor histidine kinase and response regulator